MSRRRRGTGEGGIEELPSGSWRAILCRTGPDGNRVRSSKSFPTKAQALEWHRANATAGPVQAGTFGDWLTTWLALHKSRVSTAAYRTDSYLAERIRPILGKVRIRDLTALECQLYLASLAPLTTSERHTIGRTLRMACHAAQAAGIVPASPMRGVKVPPAPKPETTSLSHTELIRLIQAAQEHGYGPLFRLWADAGLRPGELLGLKWCDLDGHTIHVRRSVEINTGELKAPKTKGSVRRIALSAGTVTGMEPGRAASELPIFPAPRGGHWWHRNFLRHTFNPVANAAQLDITPYILRHTMATLLLQAGVNLKVVSERLGHLDVTTTLRSYAHVLPGDQERAAAVMGAILSAPHVVPTR